MPCPLPPVRATAWPAVQPPEISESPSMYFLWLITHWGGLRRTGIYYLPVLEARSLRPRFWHDWFFQGLGGRSRSLPVSRLFVAPGVGPLVVASLERHLDLCSHCPRASFVCLFFLSSYQDIEFRACPNPGWSHLHVLHLLTPANTLFPKKVTFTGSGASAYLLGGAPLTHYMFQTFLTEIHSKEYIFRLGPKDIHTSHLQMKYNTNSYLVTHGQSSILFLLPFPPCWLQSL